FEISASPAGPFYGKAHRGIYTLAASLIQALTDHLSENQACSVMFTGHSMGGGISQILAWIVGVNYGHLMDVRSVAFASPHVLDTNATMELLLSAKVVRNWISE